MIPYLKTFYLDASFMVKLVADEVGSDKVRNYFFSDVDSNCLRLDAAFFTTNFCFFESFSVLKRKLCKKNQNEYLRCCRLLFAYKNERRIDIIEYPLENLNDYRKLERLTEKHGIDISDSLQLLSIKETVLKNFKEESETTLITADEGLAKAAEKEGVKVIHIS